MSQRITKEELREIEKRAQKLRFGAIGLDHGPSVAADLVRLLSEREEMEGKYRKLWEAAKELEDRLALVLDPESWSYMETRHPRQKLREALKNVEDA